MHNIFPCDIKTILRKPSYQINKKKHNSVNLPIFQILSNRVRPLQIAVLFLFQGLQRGNYATDAVGVLLKEIKNNPRLVR